MTAAKDLQRGAYIKYNNDIFKVTRKEVVACGTHSHSKTKLFVQSLYSKGEKSFNLNHQDSVEELDISRKLAQVISKSPLQVMDSHSYETLDAEYDGELNEGDEVFFITLEGKNVIIEVVRKK